MKKLTLTLLLSLIANVSIAKPHDIFFDLQKMTENKINLLILQQADSATAVPTKNHCYDLTLNGVQHEVLYFADQPSHLVGQMSNKELINLWKQDKVVHNAGVHFHYNDGADKTMNVVVTLKQPQLAATQTSLTYQACINDAKAQKTSLPKNMSAVTVFIDPLNTNIW